ncbi:MAG: helix-turn-helix domain-containing protein [Pseudonocardia sp.]
MTDDSATPSAADQAIAERARRIRTRRGLSLEQAAGLAGIGKSYLSKLETGQRRFIRRGLVEDIAQALSCSVTDLTGQPYLPPDRESADALATLPDIRQALYDTTLDDVPDLPARPVEVLAALAAQTNAYTDQTLYALAGRGLGALLTELHVHAATGDEQTRLAALTALVEACLAAAGTARHLGHPDLAVHAARRGYDAARLTGDPALIAFAAMQRASALSRIGARRRAGVIRTGALTALEAHADPSVSDTRPAEAVGTLYLGDAQLAAREGRGADADAYLAHAAELAERTGERNFLSFHFGPANVAAWRLAAAVELGNGPAAAERLDGADEVFNALGSATRRGRLHLDLARAYAQAEGSRDGEAVRHLDAADRTAPVRVRNDPIARELVLGLDSRAQRRVWELESLKNRLGVA